MLRRKFLVFLILLLPVLGGCSSSSFVPEEESFPLIQSHRVSSKETIYHLGVSDYAIVYDTAGIVEEINADTYKVNWNVDGFSPRADSDILFTGYYTVLMSYDEILLVDNQGRETYLNLNKERQDNIDLVAAYGNNIYVIRGGFWDLEVYDISKNKMIWETPTGRGGTSVFYEPTTDIAYITNPSSVRAFSNSTGKLIWEQKINIYKSAYADGKLYIAESEFKSNKYSITALDLTTRKTIWYKEFDVDSELYMNDLSILQNLLVISTRYDFLAFDIVDGTPEWQSSIDDIFYTRPVLFDNTLYAKGASKKIYALSLADGKTIGYIRLEPETQFAEPSYEAESGVYLFHDGIVFKTEKSIWFYVPK